MSIKPIPPFTVFYRETATRMLPSEAKEFGLDVIREVDETGHVVVRDYILDMPEELNDAVKQIWSTNINAHDQHGCTLLHTAVAMYREKIVEWLLSQPGIDVNARDDHGFTPLEGAVHNLRGDRSWAAWERLIADPRYRPGRELKRAKKLPTRNSEVIEWLEKHGH